MKNAFFNDRLALAPHSVEQPRKRGTLYYEMDRNYDRQPHGSWCRWYTKLYSKHSMDNSRASFFGGEVMRKLWIVMVAMALVPFAACSSDDDGGGSNNLDSSKQVSRLDEEEQQVLKDDLQQDMARLTGEEVVRRLCTVVGLSEVALGTADSCEDATEACFENASTEENEVPGDAWWKAMMESCDITVGELKSCMTDSLNAFVAWSMDISCDDDLQNIGAPEQPASCEFTSNCELVTELGPEVPEP